jgi:hypothetical protein
MAQNARVAWVVTDKPWETEEALLASLQLPLNLQGNKHRFVQVLQQIRKEAKTRARSLPIVEDNGGTRRAVVQ